MIGVAGTAAGVGLAVIRERLDRIADSRAAKQAADEQKSRGTEDTPENNSKKLNDSD
jgi:hypothetical protein